MTDAPFAVADSRAAAAPEQFAEGQINASLGAVAAFAGILGAVSALVALCVLFVFQAVTSRNLGLARVGIGVAVLSLLLSTAAFVLWTIRVASFGGAG